MSRPQFPLLQSHLDLAHSYWKSILHPGDSVIDATCGNGYDTLLLAQLSLSHERRGSLVAIDMQHDAIESTKNRLATSLHPDLLELVSFKNQCHSIFPKEIKPETIQLIVYNLGYLPGGNKTLTTLTETTIQSITQALTLIKIGGAISMTCYPGHSEGVVEENAILEFASKLNPKEWSCCHHQWINRHQSPTLLFIQRRMPLATAVGDGNEI